MRYLVSILIAAMCLFGKNTFSQVSLEVGPTIGLSTTWIVNPNMLISHQDIKPNATFELETGGNALLKLGKRFGIGAGFTSGELTQKYDWDQDTLSVISMNSTNIPVYLQFGNRFYTQTGLMLTSYDKQVLTILDDIKQDVSSAYEDNNISLFGGLGYSFHLSSHLFVNLTGRFGYGLNDIGGVTPQGYNLETLSEIADYINAGNAPETHPQYDEYSAYINYFDTAQDFANDYERLSKTRSFFTSFTASVVINLGGGGKKEKDEE